MSGAVWRDCIFKVVCETDRAPPFSRCCCYSQPQSNAQTRRLNTGTVIFLIFSWRANRIPATREFFNLGTTLTALAFYCIGLLKIHFCAIAVFQYNMLSYAYVGGYMRKGRWTDPDRIKSFSCASSWAQCDFLLIFDKAEQGCGVIKICYS